MITQFVIVVFYLTTGLKTMSFGEQAACNYWVETNARQIHGALYASDCIKVDVKRARE